MDDPPRQGARMQAYKEVLYPTAKSSYQQCLIMVALFCITVLLSLLPYQLTVSERNSIATNQQPSLGSWHSSTAPYEDRYSEGTGTLPGHPRTLQRNKTLIKLTPYLMGRGNRAEKAGLLTEFEAYDN